MKVLIAEDNLLIAEHLSDILEECEIEKIYLAHDYNEVMSLIESEKPDLILLDIHMDHELAGVKIANEVNLNFKIPFIYITAQSDKMVMDLAIETKPLGYIIKPFNSKEVYVAIQLAMNAFAKKYRIIKDIYGDVKVMLDTILYIKVDGNYLEITTRNKKIVTRSTISTFLELLPKEDFLQVHRSYVVNVKYLEKLDANHVYIESIAIPFSKNKLKEIQSKMAE